MIPKRRMRFEQNLMPGTHVSGRLLRKELAYSIPKIMPTIIGLKDRCFTKLKSPMANEALAKRAISNTPWSILLRSSDNFMWWGLK